MARYWSTATTVQPVEVEAALLAAGDAAGETTDRVSDLILALDVTKQLTDEAMKVTLAGAAPAQIVHKITKQMPISAAHGEYIGATLIRAGAADDLAAALEETWRRDPNLYYEDGYQLLADQGVPVGAAPLPPLDWVEVDDHVDLARARELACRC